MPNHPSLFDLSSMQAPPSIPVPSLSASPSSLTLTSVAGTQGSSQSYTLTGANLGTNAVTITAPTGYVVSKDNSSFASSQTLTPTAGAVSQVIYVALASSDSAGTVNGSVSNSCTGVTTVNITASGTVSVTPSLSISPSSLTGLNATAGSAGTAQTITVTFGGTTINISGPTGLEYSKDGGSTYASTQALAAGSPLALKVRVAASASAGAISGNIVFSGSGVTTQNATASGTVTSSGTAHYRAITIDHTKVPNTDQTNFPVLVAGTYSYLATVANGGKVQNASGYDIFFSTDTAGSSKLAFQRVNWNATSGLCEFWVKIPTLSHTADTVIYLQYGNTSITTDQANATGTWNSNFSFVGHLGDGTTLSLADSTSNAINGTNTGVTATAGQIGGGGAFVGATPTYISLGNNLNLIGDLTLSVWIKPTNLSIDQYLFSKGNGQPNPLAFYINQTTGIPNFFMGNGSGGYANVLGTTGVTAGVWNHLVVTRTGGVVNHYLNGVLNGSSSSFAPTIATSMDNFFLGIKGNATFAYTGSMDEPRLQTVAVGADWAKTEFNTSTPSTFYGVGVEN